VIPDNNVGIALYKFTPYILPIINSLEGFMNVSEEFKFCIGDKVTSKQLGFSGVVEMAAVSRGGREYLVLAFAGTAFVTRWLPEDLLEKV
jgi:hypothetical protein